MTGLIKNQLLLLYFRSSCTRVHAHSTEHFKINCYLIQHDVCVFILRDKI